jgi:hydrogenase maturation factor
MTGDVRCITCSDEGIEMTVVELTQCGAQCRDPNGIDQRVEIDLVEPVAIDEVLLVHAGVAIANLGATS